MLGPRPVWRDRKVWAKESATKNNRWCLRINKNHEVEVEGEKKTYIFCFHPYGDLRFQSDDGITVNLTSRGLEPYSWCAMSGFQPRQENPHIDDKWSMMVRYSSIFSVYLLYFALRLKTDPNSRWWFQTFFIFTPIWRNDPNWLIFSKWVETTN